MLRRVFGRMVYKDLFPVWEKLGFHITPNQFYQPIPDTRRLPTDLWSKHSEHVGLDLHEQEQLELLSVFASMFKKEYDTFPVDATATHSYYLRNAGGFGSVDAVVLYCIIRYYKPRSIIEVGSGFTTLLCAQAILKNREDGNDCELVSIDPYPGIVKSAHLDMLRLIPMEVQAIPLSSFCSLRENDILFIDSSHVLRVGGDVQYLYLDVLPRLQQGVLVHAHDIFLPCEYPKDWILKEHRFWTEQYLLQAFLTFNECFKVTWAGNYMHMNHPDKLEAAITSYKKSEAGVGPGSFWIRRVT